MYDLHQKYAYLSSSQEALPFLPVLEAGLLMLAFSKAILAVRLFVSLRTFCLSLRSSGYLTTLVTLAGSKPSTKGTSGSAISLPAVRGPGKGSRASDGTSTGSSSGGGIVGWSSLIPINCKAMGTWAK